MFIADAKCAHEPAQLDGEPVRVGVLLLNAVELFRALGGPTKELLHPAITGTDVESLCVKPFVRQASERHRAETQDVGHPHDVLAEPCHVCG